MLLIATFASFAMATDATRTWNEVCPSMPAEVRDYLPALIMNADQRGKDELRVDDALLVAEKTDRCTISYRYYKNLEQNPPMCSEIVTLCVTTAPPEAFAAARERAIANQKDRIDSEEFMKKAWEEKDRVVKELEEERRLKIKNDNTKSTRQEQDCAGTYLWAETAPHKFLLSKEHNLNKLKILSVEKGFNVIFDNKFSYLANWRIDRFNNFFKLGFVLNRDDHIRKGPLDIDVDMYGEVTIIGPRIVITKSISRDENYEITIEYTLDNYLLQSIDVVQNGSCTFPHSYIKNQIKAILQQLDIEFAWLDKATVQINPLFHLY
jgi:hypothetical protein